MDKHHKQRAADIRRQVQAAILEEMDSANLSTWRQDLKAAIRSALHDATADLADLIEDAAQERADELIAEYEIEAEENAAA